MIWPGTSGWPYSELLWGDLLESFIQDPNGQLQFASGKIEGREETDRPLLDLVDDQAIGETFFDQRLGVFKIERDDQAEIADPRDCGCFLRVKGLL